MNGNETDLPLLWPMKLGSGFITVDSSGTGSEASSKLQHSKSPFSSMKSGARGGAIGGAPMNETDVPLFWVMKLGSGFITLDSSGTGSEASSKLQHSSPFSSMKSVARGGAIWGAPMNETDVRLLWVMKLGSGFITVDCSSTGGEASAKLQHSKWLNRDESIQSTPCSSKHVPSSTAFPSDEAHAEEESAITRVSLMLGSGLS